MTEIKVYQPRWLRWFVLAIFIPIWGMFTWMTFGGMDGEKMPLPIWIFMTVLFVVIWVFVHLSSIHKIPSRIIHIDDEDLRRIFKDR